MYCKERKGKEEYLYSAFIQRLKALRHGSHSLPANYTMPACSINWPSICMQFM